MAAMNSQGRDKPSMAQVADFSPTPTVAESQSISEKTPRSPCAGERGAPEATEGRFIYPHSPGPCVLQTSVLRACRGKEATWCLLEPSIRSSHVFRRGGRITRKDSIGHCTYFLPSRYLVFCGCLPATCSTPQSPSLRLLKLHFHFNAPRHHHLPITAENTIITKQPVTPKRHVRQLPGKDGTTPQSSVAAMNRQGKDKQSQNVGILCFHQTHSRFTRGIDTRKGRLAVSWGERSQRKQREGLYIYVALDCALVKHV
ncbi:hypothetical protein HDK90DRAFT_96284 [Phyllosticta capitalensis]|uniref:Uncharacterized protein n=1 Tax=Phyllosticta capitalensis TaxID=121624 RepID=A0ABR1YC00_9PEZI